MAWEVGNNKQVLIDIDPWIGIKNHNFLPRHTIESMNVRGIIHIEHIEDIHNNTLLQQQWLTSQ